MLPAVHRLRHRDEFTATVRRGRRSSGTLIVVHCALNNVVLRAPHSVVLRAPHGTVLRAPHGTVHCAVVDPPRPPRAGFVVGRPVGGAVVRNRVRRRLRHLLAARLDQLPAGACVVVRAQPAAASASYTELATALDTTLRRVCR